MLSAHLKVLYTYICVIENKKTGSALLCSKTTTKQLCSYEDIAYRRPLQLKPRECIISLLIRARSSAGEHYLHTVGVSSSILLAPILRHRMQCRLCRIRSGIPMSRSLFHLYNRIIQQEVDCIYIQYAIIIKPPMRCICTDNDFPE